MIRILSLDFTLLLDKLILVIEGLYEGMKIHNFNHIQFIDIFSEYGVSIDFLTDVILWFGNSRNLENITRSIVISRRLTGELLQLLLDVKLLYIGLQT